MNKFTEGSLVMWRELVSTSEDLQAGKDPEFKEHVVMVLRNGRDAQGVYTEIKAPDGRVVKVHRSSLREGRAR